MGPPVQSRSKPTWFLTGIFWDGLKPVNDKNAHNIIQERHEDLSQLLNCLINVLLQQTNLDPETPDGNQLIMKYFFQKFPDIKTKL